MRTLAVPETLLVQLALVHVASNVVQLSAIHGAVGEVADHKHAIVCPEQDSVAGHLIVAPLTDEPIAVREGELVRHPDRLVGSRRDFRPFSMSSIVRMERKFWADFR